MMRSLLIIIVFISGAVLMALEIVGSRVLAPYFGNSIFVWGSLISVVLAALSLGYYWGGWLSAR
ncbi:MAG: fused MFS/spermidine synthase, partial [Candidatus Binatia bacterium]